MYDDIEMQLFVTNEYSGVAPLRNEIMRQRYLNRLGERRTNICHASVKGRLLDGLRTLRRLGGAVFGSTRPQDCPNRASAARLPAE